MRILFAIGAMIATLALAGAALASDAHVTGDPWPGLSGLRAVPCTDDIYVSSHTLPAGYVADGEWNPATNQSGFVASVETIIILDALGQVVSETDITGPSFPGSGLVRSFAWGLNSNDCWVGSWYSSSGPVLPKLYHLDASFSEIASYSYPDPGTGLDMQFSGLALDAANGHLWAILRNNPAGTFSRFVEFDINVDPPALLQGPIDTPWPGGPSAVSSAGLEYNSQDCTLLALRQDSNNVGETTLVVFQDVDPQGTTSGVTLLGDCSIANTPCVGAGQTTNRPWGISLVEGPPNYAIFSDLNLDGSCSAIEQPADFHLITPPQFTGICLSPVNPSTWGQIKSRYTN